MSLGNVGYFRKWKKKYSGNRDRRGRMNINVKWLLTKNDVVYLAT